MDCCAAGKVWSLSPPGGDAAPYEIKATCKAIQGREHDGAQGSAALILPETKQCRQTPSSGSVEPSLATTPSRAAQTHRKGQAERSNAAGDVLQRCELPPCSCQGRVAGELVDLACAVVDGCLRCVEAALQAGQDPRCARAGAEKSPILLELAASHRAAQKERVLQALLAAPALGQSDRQALLDTRGQFGQTALHVAAKHDPAFAHALLSQNASARLFDGQGDQPLHCALRGLARALALRRFEPGPPKGSGTEEQPTSSSDSSDLVSSLRLVRLLVSRGARVSTAGAGGKLPLQLACEARSPAAVELLLNLGADTSAKQAESDLTPLCSALQGPWHPGDVDAVDACVELLLRAGADPNAWSADADTSPLILAVKRGACRSVALLLQHGARVNCAKANAWTPLHHVGAPSASAPDEALAACVPALVSAGAHVDARTSDQFNTPLLSAAWCGRPAVVRALLAAGADPLATNGRGSGAIHNVVSYSAHEAARYHIACMDGAFTVIAPSEAALCSVVRELVRAGSASSRGGAAVSMQAQVNARNDFGTPPLMWAAQSSRTELVACLLALGADPNCCDRNGTTPLHAAAGVPLPDTEPGKPAAVQRVIHLLIEAGAKVDARTKSSGITPLMNAASYGNWAAVQELLRAGADVDIPSRGLSTPLHYACTQACCDATAASTPQAGYCEVVEALLRCGSDAKRKDSQGFTPALMAVWAGRHLVLQCLLAHSAFQPSDCVRGWGALHVVGMRGSPASDADLAKCVKVLHRAAAAGTLPVPGSKYLKLLRNMLPRIARAAPSPLALMGLNKPLALDDFNCSPLCLAATAGRPRTVAALLKAGASLHEQCFVHEQGCVSVLHAVCCVRRRAGEATGRPTRGRLMHLVSLHTSAPRLPLDATQSASMQSWPEVSSVLERALAEVAVVLVKAGLDPTKRAAAQLESGSQAALSPIECAAMAGTRHIVEAMHSELNWQRRKALLLCRQPAPGPQRNEANECQAPPPTWALRGSARVLPMEKEGHN